MPQFLESSEILLIVRYVVMYRNVLASEELLEGPERKPGHFTDFAEGELALLVEAQGQFPTQVILGHAGAVQHFTWYLETYD